MPHVNVLPMPNPLKNGTPETVEGDIGGIPFTVVVTAVAAPTLVPVDGGMPSCPSSLSPSGS